MKTIGAHRLLLPTLVLCAAFVSGSDSAPNKASVWRPLRQFLGTWEGDVSGESGFGTAERIYRFMLRDQFIQIMNKSVYPPQEKNPKGEIHEDVGFISYDARAKKFVLRQFHAEGFVNQFALERFDDRQLTLVFVSTAIENIAPGWRAKETYRFLNKDEFVETFALAQPGKDFATYSETHFRRKPSS